MGKSIAGTSTDWTITDSLFAHYGMDGPDGVPGRIGRAADFDGKRYIELGDTGKFGFADKFTLAAWASQPLPTAPSSAAPGRSGGNPRLRHTSEGRKVQVNLVQRWLDDALRVETRNPLELNPGTT
jgi:hypothetical protein